MIPDYAAIEFSSSQLRFKALCFSDQDQLIFIQFSLIYD